MKTDSFTWFVKEAFSKDEFPEHEMFMTDYWIGDVNDIVEWNGKHWIILDYSWEFENLENQMEVIY